MSAIEIISSDQNMDIQLYIEEIDKAMQEMDSGIYMAHDDVKKALSTK